MGILQKLFKKTATHSFLRPADPEDKSLSDSVWLQLLTLLLPELNKNVNENGVKLYGLLKLAKNIWDFAWSNI